MSQPDDFRSAPAFNVPEFTPLSGIFFKLASVGVFLIMSSLLKATEGIPAGELVFFRSIFAIVPITLFLGVRGELISGFKTKSVFGHFLRGLVGVISMGLGFYALTQLPLLDAVAIGYATPLFIVVVGAVFMHEVVRAYRWSAVLAGFAGVAIIIWPRLTLLSGGGGTHQTTFGALAALAGCCFAAFAMLQVRRLVKTERSSTIALYFSITASVISLLTLPFGWVMPTPQQGLLLIGAGVAGGIAQILLTECYRRAEMSVIAPFEYASLLFSIAIGYFVFAEAPTLFTLVGGVIVMGSGLFIIFREHRLGLDRAKARGASTPQG